MPMFVPSTYFITIFLICKMGVNIIIPITEDSCEDTLEKPGNVLKAELGTS